MVDKHIEVRIYKYIPGVWAYVHVSYVPYLYLCNLTFCHI